MELQIQDLVSSIRKEGIDAARTEAESILAQAKEQAAAILAEAKAAAQQETARSASEIETLKESARVSAQQAERDAALSFKDSVKAEFEKILAADVAKTVQGPALAKLIGAVLADENPADYTAEVAEITEGLKSELAAKVKEGLELRVSKNVRAGFRLAAKDGSGYFDCTDEEIMKMLMPFFSEINI